MIYLRKENMSIKTTLPATEVRKNFFDILDEVSQTNVPYTITVKGKPKAVIMNAEEYDSWQETLDIMSNPELVKGIEEGKKDLREGRYITLDEYMAKNKLAFIRDKSGEYTVVSTKTSKKSKK